MGGLGRKVLIPPVEPYPCGRERAGRKKAHYYSPTHLAPLYNRVEAYQLYDPIANLSIM